MTSMCCCSFWLALMCLVKFAVANVVVLRENNVTEADYVSYGAFFGSVVDSDGITGYVVYADPPEACDTIVSRSSFEKNVTLPRKWIALIRRGKCAFSHKVWIAQEAGFDAAIVHNVGSQSLIHMSSSSGDDNVRIPSVFIGEREGVELSEHYQWNSGFYVVVTDEFPVININTILLPFAIVVGVCFLMLFGFVVGRWIRERRRQQRHRLPKRELRKIPTKKFADGDKYDVCAICLEQFSIGEKIRVLPCEHTYHIKCIDPWLLHSKRVCPVCKQKVIPGDHSDSEDEAAPPIGIHRSNTVIPSVTASLPGPSGVSSMTTNSHGSINNDSVIVIQRENLARRSDAEFCTPDSSPPSAAHSLNADAVLENNDSLLSASLPVYAAGSSLKKLDENETKVSDAEQQNNRMLTVESPLLLQKLVASGSSLLSDESMMPLLHTTTTASSSSSHINNGATTSSPTKRFSIDSQSSKRGGNDADRNLRGRSSSQTHDALNRDFSLAAGSKIYNRTTSSSGSGGKRSNSSYYVNKSFDASFDDHQPTTTRSKFVHRKHGSLTTTTTTIADVNPRVAQADDNEVLPADKQQRLPVIRRKKQRYDSTVSTDTNQSYIVNDDNNLMTASVGDKKNEDHVANVDAV